MLSLQLAKQEHYHTIYLHYLHHFVLFTNVAGIPTCDYLSAKRQSRDSS